jgi:hypothetical protein
MKISSAILESLQSDRQAMATLMDALSLFFFLQIFFATAQKTRDFLRLTFSGRLLRSLIVWNLCKLRSFSNVL